jgi:hypothetical protein
VLFKNMMKLIGILPVIFLVGCSSNSDSVPEKLDNSISDAGGDVGTHSPPSGICCQITHNETDSVLWNNRRYPCLPDDAGLDPFDPPWVCNVSPVSGDCAPDSTYECLSCDQTACVTGMYCVGANGTGVVVACDSDSGN